MCTVRGRATILVCLGLLVLLAASSPAYALRVGWNVDIKQVKFNDYADGFHVWGLLESGDPLGNNPPTFTSQVNFLTSGPDGVPPWNPGPQALDTFGAPQIGGVIPAGHPLPPGPPNPINPPWYFFDANWSTSTGQQIPNNQWVHFGLEFNEECHNIGYWLRAGWKQGALDPPVPIYGFKVLDGYPTLPPQERRGITIQNASEAETSVLAMDLLVLSKADGDKIALADLNTDYFRDHSEFVWTQVPLDKMHGLGSLGVFQPDSFFDVFFDEIEGLPQLQPEGYVIARQHSEYSGYVSSSGDYWQYELHEANTPEPGTLVLLGTATLGLLAYAWRRRRS